MRSENKTRNIPSAGLFVLLVLLVGGVKVTINQNQVVVIVLLMYIHKRDKHVCWHWFCYVSEAFTTR